MCASEHFMHFVHHGWFLTSYTMDTMSGQISKGRRIPSLDGSVGPFEWDVVTADLEYYRCRVVEEVDEHWLPVPPPVQLPWRLYSYTSRLGARLTARGTPLSPDRLRVPLAPIRYCYPHASRVTDDDEKSSERQGEVVGGLRVGGSRVGGLIFPKVFVGLLDSLNLRCFYFLQKATFTNLTRLRRTRDLSPTNRVKMQHIMSLFVVILIFLCTFSSYTTRTAASNFDVSSLKRKIYTNVKGTSNLVRNRVALEQDICALESRFAGTPPNPGISMFNKLDGDWSLLYTNNAGRESFLSSTPIIPGIVELDSVEQNCKLESSLVYHILRFSGLRPTTVTLTHSATVTSFNAPIQVALDLDDVSVDCVGLPKLPSFQLKKFIRPNIFRRGYFDVSWLIFALLSYNFNDQPIFEF